MNARDKAAAAWGDGFAAMEAEYSGFRHITPTAYVLAHLVSVAWPIERMATDHAPDGDCWFVVMAAGDLREIAAALRAERLTLWVAFHHRGLPFLQETHRFLFHDKAQQRLSHRAPEGGLGRTAPHEPVSEAVYETPTAGDGSSAATALQATACHSNAGPGECRRGAD